jgi:hypothetical protein
MARDDALDAEALATTNVRELPPAQRSESERQADDDLMASIEAARARLCECGRPSRHEQGWCGAPCVASIGGCTGCYATAEDPRGQRHGRPAT